MLCEYTLPALAANMILVPRIMNAPSVLQRKLIHAIVFVRNLLQPDGWGTWSQQLCNAALETHADRGTGKRDTTMIDVHVFGRTNQYYDTKKLQNSFIAGAEFPGIISPVDANHGTRQSCSARTRQPVGSKHATRSGETSPWQTSFEIRTGFSNGCCGRFATAKSRSLIIWTGNIWLSQPM